MKYDVVIARNNVIANLSDATSMTISMCNLKGCKSLPALSKVHEGFSSQQ